MGDEEGVEGPALGGPCSGACLLLFFSPVPSFDLMLESPQILLVRVDDSA